MVITRLGSYGGPRQSYGAFAPKALAGGKSTDQITRLGLYGGPRQLYGDFSGKTSAGGKSTDRLTRLGLYGGPRGLYGDFSGKTESIDVAQNGGDSSKRALDSSLDALLVREDEEILAFIMAIGRRKR